MSNHTPGPWTACCLSRIPHYVFGPGGDEAICAMSANDPNGNYPYEPASGTVTIEQCRANARLIAAAPDLLESLESAESILTALNGRNCDLETDLYSIRAIIAKATGKEEA